MPLFQITVFAAWLSAAGIAHAQDLRGHGGPVRALAVQGATVFSGSFDTRAIVWDGYVARQVTRAHSGAVTAVLPLPGNKFVSGGQDGQIAIWSDGAEPIRFEQWHEMPIVDLAPWPGGFASASWDGKIAMWDGQDPPQVLQGHDGQITGLVTFGTGLASSGSDLQLRIWRRDGSSAATYGLTAHPADLATNGQALFVAGADGRLRRIEPEKPSQEVELTTRPLVSVAAKGDRIAASNANGQVWVLNADNLDIRAQFETTQGPVWAIALTDEFVLTGGNDGLIRRWSLQGEPLGSGNGKTDPTLTSPRGAEVFRACAVCHSLTPDAEQRAGPTLYRVFGRKIGTAEGYDYSPHLREMEIVWTPETVSELFEYGPTAYTPGSRMPEQRIPSASDRQALIEFLQRAAR